MSNFVYLANGEYVNVNVNINTRKFNNKIEQFVNTNEDGPPLPQMGGLNAGGRILNTGGPILNTGGPILNAGGSVAGGLNAGGPILNAGGSVAGGLNADGSVAGGLNAFTTYKAPDTMTSGGNTYNPDSAIVSQEQTRTVSQITLLKIQEHIEQSTDLLKELLKR